MFFIYFNNILCFYYGLQIVVRHKILLFMSKLNNVNKITSKILFFENDGFLAHIF
jgi:hypothetical protein